MSLDLEIMSLNLEELLSDCTCRRAAVEAGRSVCEGRCSLTHVTVIAAGGGNA